MFRERPHGPPTNGAAACRSTFILNMHVWCAIRFRVCSLARLITLEKMMCDATKYACLTYYLDLVQVEWCRRLPWSIFEISFGAKLEKSWISPPFYCLAVIVIPIDIFRWDVLISTENAKTLPWKNGRYIGGRISMGTLYKMTPVGSKLSLKRGFVINFSFSIHPQKIVNPDKPSERSVINHKPWTSRPGRYCWRKKIMRTWCRSMRISNQWLFGISRFIPWKRLILLLFWDISELFTKNRIRIYRAAFEKIMSLTRTILTWLKYHASLGQKKAESQVTAACFTKDTHIL